MLTKLKRPFHKRRVAYFSVLIAMVAQITVAQSLKVKHFSDSNNCAECQASAKPFQPLAQTQIPIGKNLLNALNGLGSGGLSQNNAPVNSDQPMAMSSNLVNTNSLATVQTPMPARLIAVPGQPVNYQYLNNNLAFPLMFPMYFSNFYFR